MAQEIVTFKAALLQSAKNFLNIQPSKSRGLAEYALIDEFCGWRTGA